MAKMDVTSSAKQCRLLGELLEIKLLFDSGLKI
jgi:hypothetical protein